MSLGFTKGAYNLASGTRDAFGALSDNLVREGYPRMVSRSGDREPADQLKIWYERMTLTPGSRTVYGTAYWQGKTWYRIHPDKVGIPGTSNHEKRRSNDLEYPYNTSSTGAHKRAQALSSWYNITWEGKNFSEPWHWTYWGALGTISNPATAGEIEEDMPLDDNDKKWLNDMGASIVAQVAAKLTGVPTGVWEYKIQAQDATGHGVTDSQGKVVSYPASGYLASINALSGAARGEIAKVNAAIAGLGTADIDIDVPQLAAELRNGLAPEIAEALGQALINGSK